MASVTNQQLIPKIFLNRNLLTTILSFASPKELALRERVNKLWKDVSGNEKLWQGIDLTKCFKLTVINDGSKVSNKDRMPRKEMIRKMYVLSPLVENDAGLILLTVTQGLSIKTFYERFPTHFRPNFVEASPMYSNVEKETYNVILTNGVLKGTCEVSVPSMRGDISLLEFSVPKMVELTAFLMTRLKEANVSYPMMLCDETFTNGKTYDCFIACDKIPTYIPKKPRPRTKEEQAMWDIGCNQVWFNFATYGDRKKGVGAAFKC